MRCEELPFWLTTPVDGSPTYFTLAGRNQQEMLAGFASVREAG
jgi:hypothetical protein